MSWKYRGLRLTADYTPAVEAAVAQAVHTCVAHHQDEAPRIEPTETTPVATHAPAVEVSELPAPDANEAEESDGSGLPSDIAAQLRSFRRFQGSAQQAQQQTEGRGSKRRGAEKPVKAARRPQAGARAARAAPARGMQNDPAARPPVPAADPVPAEERAPAPVPAPRPLEVFLPEDVQRTLSVPESIASKLREYQTTGVNWLLQAYGKGRGALLCDDMGMGKTIQTVAFLSAVLDLGRIRNGDVLHRKLVALIVVPATVLDNWMGELQTWAPELRVAKARGPMRDARLRDAREGALEVVLTSYDCYKNAKAEFDEVPWHLCICDEAHVLKNGKTNVHKALARISTKLRYGLTGTPMPNEPKELYWLVDWAVPGHFGDMVEFGKTYSKPIQQGQSAEADQAQKTRHRVALDHMWKDLDGYLLARNKADYLTALPRKHDAIVMCRLSTLQYEVYNRLLQSPDVSILSAPLCACGSNRRSYACCNEDLMEEMEKGLIWKHLHTDGERCDKCPTCCLLPVILHLLQIANHLELIKASPERDTDPEVLKWKRALATWLLGDEIHLLGGPDLDKRWLSLISTSHCGKLAVLCKLLARWHLQQDKVLIFSHSVRLLDIIQACLEKEGHRFVRLDGSTPTMLRQRHVNDFNEQPSLFVFLLSTRAGGLGLNLTAANRVVVFDPSWNPAQDLQAQDRAYRIGQDRDVTVYRLVAAGTLEEVVYQRQVYKQQQSNMVVERKAEKRYWSGVQKTGGQQGELWGIHNMLRFDLAGLQTSAFMDGALNGKQPGKFEIQELDPVAMAALRAEADRTKAPGAQAAGATASYDDDAHVAMIEPLLALELAQEGGGGSVIDGGSGDESSDAASLIDSQGDSPVANRAAAPRPAATAGDVWGDACSSKAAGAVGAAAAVALSQGEALGLDLSGDVLSSPARERSSAAAGPGGTTERAAKHADAGAGATKRVKLETSPGAHVASSCVRDGAMQCPRPELHAAHACAAAADCTQPPSQSARPRHAAGSTQCGGAAATQGASAQARARARQTVEVMHELEAIEGVGIAVHTHDAYLCAGSQDAPVASLPSPAKRTATRPKRAPKSAPKSEPKDESPAPAGLDAGLLSLLAGRRRGCAPAAPAPLPALPESCLVVPDTQSTDAAASATPLPTPPLVDTEGHAPENSAIPQPVLPAATTAQTVHAGPRLSGLEVLDMCGDEEPAQCRREANDQVAHGGTGACPQVAVRPGERPAAVGAGAQGQRCPAARAEVEAGGSESASGAAALTAGERGRRQASAHGASASSQRRRRRQMTDDAFT